MRKLFKTITLIILSPLCIIYYLLGFFFFDNECTACPKEAAACETCKLKNRQKGNKGNAKS